MFLYAKNAGAEETYLLFALYFSGSQKICYKLVDISANFTCIQGGGIYFFLKIFQIYFSDMCPSLSMAVMGDLSSDQVNMKLAVS